MFRKKCETHDKPSPYTIAVLEVETGVDPDALTKLRAGWLAGGSAVSAFANPDLIDCGNKRCQKRG